MVFTSAGLSGVQVAIGVDSAQRPQYMAIGSGSGAVATTNILLIGEKSRRTPTSTSTSVTNKITYITDWNSVEMSGIDLQEFGMFPTSVSSAGSCYSREGFTGVEFDGTNELQIQLTYEVY